MDFENGNLNGWTTLGNVSIVDHQQLEYYGGFPLSVSGHYGVKLGNKNTPLLSKISRTLTIDNSTKYFIYSYAIILLGYPHEQTEAANVQIKIYDENNNPIPCTNFIAYAQSSSGDGFYESPKEPEQNLGGECCYPIFYQPWKTNAIDLSTYIGQELKIEFISQWCVYSVDWGYAYVDAYCTSDLVKSYSDCSNENYFIQTINGFDTYNWSGPGITSGQGTPEIAVNQPGLYTVDIPNPNIGCSPIHLEIETDLKEIPDIPIADFEATSLCVEDTSYFTNTSQSLHNIYDCVWFIEDDTIQNAQTPWHSFGSTGHFNVKLIVTNEIGCIDSIQKTVLIQDPPQLELGEELFLCTGEKLEIYNLINPNKKLTWWDGSYSASHWINSEGIYFAELFDGYCSSRDSVRIIGDGQYLGEIPNIFTPNGDNINDLFEIKSSKLTFYHILITNRWGEPVFQSSDPTIHWDGSIDGKLASEGTYFYVIKFLCNNDERSKSGFLELVH